MNRTVETVVKTSKCGKYCDKECFFASYDTDKDYYWCELNPLGWTDRLDTDFDTGNTTRWPGCVANEIRKPSKVKSQRCLDCIYFADKSYDKKDGEGYAVIGCIHGGWPVSLNLPDSADYPVDCPKMVMSDD